VQFSIVAAYSELIIPGTELNEQGPLFLRSVSIADPSDDKIKGRKGSFAASTCSWFFEIETNATLVEL
jgi:hypothetical protein